MPTIFIKDDLRRSVEAASGGKQTVLYTALGQPTYMNIIPKFRLEDIDPTLGTGVHPAFIVNGVEKSEIYVGTYQGIVKNGELLSLPNVDPSASANHDYFVSTARACGAGFHSITNAEFSALALWTHKNGFMPRGNSNWGLSSDAPHEVGRRQDGLRPGLIAGTARTLTGSGPASWRHDNTHSGIADLNGNIWEWTPGLRLVDGEIQIIPNNDAALSTTDMGVNSAAWKAILPDGSLVAPGTAGTLKYDSSAVVTGFEAQQPVLSDVRNNPTTVGGTEFYTATSYQGLTAKEGLNIPGIVKALGIYPRVNAGLGDDRLYVRNVGERLAFRGGDWYNGSAAGVFALDLADPRSIVVTGVGGRPAFVL